MEDLKMTLGSLMNSGRYIGVMDVGDGTWRLAAPADTPDRFVTFPSLLSLPFTFHDTDFTDSVNQKYQLTVVADSGTYRFFGGNDRYTDPLDFDANDAAIVAALATISLTCTCVAGLIEFTGSSAGRPVNLVAEDIDLDTIIGSPTLTCTETQAGVRAQNSTQFIFPGP